ncbi:MAG: hypothetical protein KDK70_02090 [Myxococcales bacterium]|nr:hypothetical protein [Myxococcales bacterium]
MLVRSAVLLGLVSLLGAPACVLTAPDVGAPLRELRAQQRRQVDRVATAFCALYYDCGCTEIYPTHETEDECLELVTDGLLGRLEQGINKELDYDPTCLDASAELLEALGCTTSDRLIVDADLERLYDAAVHCLTYSGDLPLNQECTPLPSARAGECEPGLRCDDGLRMCFDAALLAEGQPCSSSGQECDSGLWCDWSNSAQQMVCIRPVAAGSSCLYDTFCELDTWCDPQQDFTCQPLPKQGEPCAGSFDEGGCGYGLRCEQSVCVLEAGPGDPCDGGCQPGLRCNDEGLCELREAVVCDFEASLP